MMKQKTYKVTVRAIGRHVWFREDVIEVTAITRTSAARQGKRIFRELYKVDECIVVEVIQIKP